MLNPLVNFERSRCASVGVRRRPEVVHKPPSNSRSAATLSLRLANSAGAERVIMFTRFFSSVRDFVCGHRAPCSVCESVLLNQAREQLSAGYYVGAIASARCELVERLRMAMEATGLIHSRPQKHQTRRVKAQWMAWTLCEHGYLNNESRRRLSRIADQTTRMIDTSHKSTEDKAEEVISDIRAACAELDEQLRTILRKRKQHDSPPTA